MFRRIRWRLVGWNLLILGLILAVVSVAVYTTLSRSLMGQVDRTLAARGEELIAAVHAERDDKRREHEIAEALEVGREGYRGALFYLMVNREGQILANPQGAKLDDTLAGISLERGPYHTTRSLDGVPARLYISPVSERGDESLALVVGQSLLAEQDALRRLLLVLIGSGGAGILLSLLGAWFLAGRALVPIQRAFSRQLEFVADAAHELRTPLTVLRAATDLLHQHRAETIAENGELLDDVRQEIGRLERLVGDLLTLARGDLGELDLAVGRVDLTALASDVVRRTGPLALDRRITLACRADDGALPVEGDPDRLQQVLLILLDNALKHTPPGGVVTVATARRGADILLSVSDSGEGIPAERLERIFDRFYRGDKARTRDHASAGLGLAIARSLVEAHDGQLTVSSAVGVGTTATVRLHCDRDLRRSAHPRLGKADQP